VTRAVGGDLGPGAALGPRPLTPAPVPAATVTEPARLSGPQAASGGQPVACESDFAGRRGSESDDCHGD
jgi:hypothetical protein